MGRQGNYEIAGASDMTDVAAAAAVHLVVDNEVWVADAAKSWVCGKVTAIDGDSVIVSVKDEKEDRKIKVTDVHRANAKMQGGAEVRVFATVHRRVPHDTSRVQSGVLARCVLSRR